MITNTAPKQQLTIFGRFSDLLPKKPFCSDDFAYGLRIRTKSSAVKYRYIQHNQPAIHNWLVFDLDHENPLIWEDAGVAVPNIITRNPDNGRCHLLYAVSAVCTSDAAKPRPLAYMAAIQHAYNAALRADQGYVGLVTKNPLHDHWHVLRLHDDVYSLGELADFVDLTDVRWTRKRAQNDDQYGLGRHCALFHRVRYWAYDHVNDYRVPGGAFEVWHTAVLSHCEASNTFPEPLPYGDVKSTAKSVARWVWKHYTGNGSGKRRGAMSDTFKNSQIPLDIRAKQHFAALRTHERRRSDTEKRIMGAIARYAGCDWAEGYTRRVSQGCFKVSLGIASLIRTILESTVSIAPEKV